MRSVASRAVLGIVAVVLAGAPTAMALQPARFGGALVVATSSDPGTLNGAIFTSAALWPWCTLVS